MSTYGRVKDSKTQADEHVDLKGVSAKRVLLSGYDGSNINDSDIDSLGALSTVLKGNSVGLTGLNILVSAGRYINAKTTDDDIHMTLLGFYIGTTS